MTMKADFGEKSHVAMSNCFFCGKPFKILLDRRLLPTLPRNVGVIDMEPCNECAEWMKKGIILLEVRDGEFEGVEKARLQHKIDWDLASDYDRSKMAPFIPNPFRTGGFWVASEDMIKRLMKGPTADGILKSRWTFIDQSTANLIGLPRNEKEEKTEKTEN